MTTRRSSPHREAWITAGFAAAAVLIVIAATLLWGWILMLIAGAFGWNIAYWPQACLLGFLFACLTSGGARAAR